MSAPLPGLTILVSSFDAFYDSWHPFFYFFRRHWPDCPFPIRLLTNHFRLDEGPIRELAIGDDRGWADNLIEALKHIDTEYVVYIQEDQFIPRTVNTVQFLDDFQYCVDHGVHALSYRAFGSLEPGYEETLHPRFGVIGRDSKHRTKADPCIWRTETLRQMMKPGETAWDFLTTGSDRCRDLYFLRYHRQEESTIDYLAGSAIRRGMWRPEGMKMCVDAGIKVEPGYRCVSRRTRGLVAALKKKYTQWASRRDMRSNPKRVVPLNQQLAASGF